MNSYLKTFIEKFITSFILMTFGLGAATLLQNPDVSAALSLMLLLAWILAYLIRFAWNHLISGSPKGES